MQHLLFEEENLTETDLEITLAQLEAELEPYSDLVNKVTDPQTSHEEVERIAKAEPEMIRVLQQWLATQSKMRSLMAQMA